jgi:hypothetical protein
MMRRARRQAQRQEWNSLSITITTITTTTIITTTLSYLVSSVA